MQAGFVARTNIWISANESKTNWFACRRGIAKVRSMQLSVRLNMSSTDTPDMPLLALQEIERALRDIQFGTIEITLHEGRITQIERREKVRFAADRQARAAPAVRAVA